MNGSAPTFIGLQLWPYPQLQAFLEDLKKGKRTPAPKVMLNAVKHLVLNRPYSPISTGCFTAFSMTSFLFCLIILRTLIRNS